MALEQRLDLGPHPPVQPELLLGDPQGRQQADGHRLAVPVTLVSGRRLERVRERVAEVERGANAELTLVLGHDRELRPHAAFDHRRSGLRLVPERALDRRQPPHPLPQAAARDKTGLDHLGKACSQLRRGQRRE